jgi:hypothetical protein
MSQQKESQTVDSESTQLAKQLPQSSKEDIKMSKVLLVLLYIVLSVFLMIYNFVCDSLKINLWRK